MAGLPLPPLGTAILSQDSSGEEKAGADGLLRLRLLGAPRETDMAWRSK